MKKKAFVYFHQGWTDIIVCMALINYYRSLYDEIVFMARSDAKELVDFYIRGLEGVTPLYFLSDNGRYYGAIQKEDILEVNYTPDNNNPGHGFIAVPRDYTMEMHAEHDRWREDDLNGFWGRNGREAKLKFGGHFTEMFYSYYDIDYNYRISFFNVNRDLELEDKTYQDFIAKHGTNYVCYHDDETNHLHGGLHVSTKINFGEEKENAEYVNLNKISPTFFEYIKVLQNAKELHFVDSIWGCLVYQLDARYGLFKHIPITVHCLRGHQLMFEQPVKLDNWKVI